MELEIDDRIRTRKVKFFNNFTLDLKYDAVGSAFGFNFYFNSDNIELKELACIGHYHICRIKHNGELLLTGYILSEDFTDSSKKEFTSFSGYSKPGVLEDCQIPPSLYPLQSDGLTLKEIATKFCSKFDFKIVIDPLVSSLMNQAIDETTAKDGQTIKSYLSELCAQKNIIISHTPEGDLFFTRAKTKQAPIISFESGKTGFTDMKLSFNGQAMHSEITVIKQASEEDDNAGQSTIKNPYVPYVFRPKVLTQNSGTDNDTEKAARNALSEELQNLKIVIETDKWEIAGKVIKPNNIVSILNPNVYLYKKTNFFIESVTLKGDNTSLTATLNCVLPEVYNNEIPKYIFAGINLH